MVKRYFLSFRASLVARTLHRNDLYPCVSENCILFLGVGLACLLRARPRTNPSLKGIRAHPKRTSSAISEGEISRLSTCLADVLPDDRLVAFAERIRSRSNTINFQYKVKVQVQVRFIQNRILTDIARFGGNVAIKYHVPDSAMRIAARR